MTTLTVLVLVAIVFTLAAAGAQKYAPLWIAVLLLGVILLLIVAGVLPIDR